MRINQNTFTLEQALSAKLANNTNSDKTLKKLDKIAFRLIGVSNSQVTLKEAITLANDLQSFTPKREFIGLLQGLELVQGIKDTLERDAETKKMGLAAHRTLSGYFADLQDNIEAQIIKMGETQIYPDMTTPSPERNLVVNMLHGVETPLNA